MPLRNVSAGFDMAPAEARVGYTLRPGARWSRDCLPARRSLSPAAADASDAL